MYIVTDKTVGIAIGIPPTISTRILSSVVQSFPGSVKKQSKLSTETNKTQHTPCKASARLLSNRELNDKFQSYTNRNKYNAKEANVLQHILKMALLWREKRRLIIALPLVLFFGGGCSRDFRSAQPRTLLDQRRYVFPLRKPRHPFLPFSLEILHRLYCLDTC